jgi:hypothetical protein
MTNDSKFSVDFGLSAKAEVSGKVPDTVMGRMGNALADTLSPFTEGLGLVGDAIRAHRITQVIRRAEATRQLLDSAGRQITGAPLKFIAPWAEAVSLEEENSELNSMWEHLLANASTAYEGRYNGYIDILKRMSSDEARLLNELCRHGTIDPVFEIEREWLRRITGDLKPLLEGLPDVETPIHPLGDDDSISIIHVGELDKVFNHDWQNPRRVALFSYPIFKRMTDRSIKISGKQYYYAPGITGPTFFAHQNLIREGLLYRDTTELTIDRQQTSHVCTVWFLQATEIGVDLVKTCNILKPPLPQS